MQTLNRLLGPISSLRLTIICLAAALVLVFAGTLAQVRFGLFFVQEQYFQSWVVWWSPANADYKIPVFPGGHLVGAVLLVNLVAAHIRRFSWTWKKCGIQLTHFGLIVMLAGGLATDLFSVSSVMSLTRGETKNYSEDQERMELAVIDHTDPADEQVTAIPGEVLAKGGEVPQSSLPFKVVVRSYFRNSKLNMIGQEPGASVAAASQGTGQRVAVTSAPRATKMDERDVMSAVVELIPIKGGDTLGTWLVSDALAAAQDVEYDGRKWSLQLRPARYYKPYSLTLRDFSHDTYAGTQISKNFSSKVDLTDFKTNDTRQVLIYMNHPLRHEGDTYYQYKMDDNGTVLQVVRNPSYQAPYISCIIVSLGLIFQFTYHLIGFARRTKPTTAS